MPDKDRLWTTHLTRVASRDYEQIVDWTEQTFGVRQAERYGTAIMRAVQSLSAGPNILGSRPRDDIGPGIRSLHIARPGQRGRHLLVYRASMDRVIVIDRILHDAMDIARHLPVPDDPEA